jgi:hypothetical protein
MNKYLRLLPWQAYILALGFFLATVVLHWRLQISVGILWYALGALIGLHVFDILEKWVVAGSGRPSPLRNVAVQIIISVLSIFILTSTGSWIGSGVVLFLNLRLLLLQQEQFNQTGTLTPWFSNSMTANKSRDTNYLGLLTIVLIIETVIFILV